MIRPPRLISLFISSVSGELPIFIPVRARARFRQAVSSGQLAKVSSFTRRKDFM